MIRIPKISAYLKNYFKVPTLTKARYHLFGVVMASIALTVGLVVGGWKIYKAVFALTESTKSMPADIVFNQGGVGSLAGYSDGGGAVSVLSSEIRLSTASAWWNREWAVKKQITLTNNTSSTISSTASATITVNTKQLYDAGKLKINCEDLRVVYDATSSSHLEIPRTINLASGATSCADSSATSVIFPLQGALTTSAKTDNKYYLYYGNSQATAPSWPKEKYLTFDGVRQNVTVASTFNQTNMTLSSWVYLPSTSNRGAFIKVGNEAGTGIGVGGSSFEDYGNRLILLFEGVRWIGTGQTIGTGWHHVAMTVDGTGTPSAYLDGNLLGTYAGTPATAPATNISYIGGYAIGVHNRFFSGSVDEAQIWGRVLSQSEIRSRMYKELDSSDPYWSDLKGYWKMDEGSGQTVNDSSVYGKTGTLGADSNTGTDDPIRSSEALPYNIGAKTATLVAPLNGTTTAVASGGVATATTAGPLRYTTKGALQFNGKTSYLTVANSSSLQLTNSFAVSLWFKPSDLSQTNKYLLTKGNDYAILWEYDDNCVRFYALGYSGTDPAGDSKMCLTSKDWHHVVYSYDGSNWNGYVDGVNLYSRVRTFSLRTSTNSLIIGAATSIPTAAFRGSIDEMGIWNRAISSSEVTTLYNSGTASPIVPDGNTKLLYHFDENGNDPRNSGKVLDASGTNNNGTIYGATYTDGIVSASATGGHTGIMVEEGTTNLIPNPSFENNITDGGWVGKANVNFTSTQTDADGNYLLGSNTITDVFYYDTTKDTDGGAWRNNATAQASSWYNEAFSTTRGRKKEFPEKAYIISENSYVDIVDAVENKLWMRFISDGTSSQNMAMCYGGTAQPATAVYALNGKLYITATGSLNCGLRTADFTSDSGRWYRNGGWHSYNGTISQRASRLGWGTVTAAMSLLSSYANDVSVAYIGGAQYVAVATDGGVNVINETAGSVINIYSSTQTQIYKNVFLTPSSLYFTYNLGATSNPWRLGAVYTNSVVWQNGTTGMASPSILSGYYPAGKSSQVISTNNSLPLPTGDSYNGFNSLYVTQGTSTVDGTSNTIYAGGIGGAYVLQEKQGDEAHGSVKYYDKNHITEEMMGTVKGQWGFWQDTTTGDANQFKTSGYFNSGKLGQSTSLYGNAAGTTSSYLSFPIGAQISGNNYEHWNPNQGTISFWVKPDWDGNDGKDHYFFSRNYYGRDIQISKTSGNTFSVYFVNDGTTRSLSSSVSSWTAGTWHHIAVRWNAFTPVSGSSYAELYIDGSLVKSYTSNWTPPTPAATKPSFIGNLSYDGSGAFVNTNPANALIDDFAILDRPASTTEIAALYNSGTGNEVGSIADASLKFYAKLDGSGTLQPVTYNAGTSASKMTAKSTELTGGTNLVADGNMEASGSANWTMSSGDSITKITSGVAFDSQILEVKASVGAAGMAYQSFTTVSGDNYTVSGWLKNGSSTNPQVLINSPTYATINSYVPGSSAIWTYFNFSFKAASTTSRIYLREGNGAGGTVLFDNVSVTHNLVDNGGMEVFTGTADDGTTDTFSSWTSYNTDDTAGNKIEATATSHSGTYATKITRVNATSTLLQNISVTPGNSYLLSFWTRGDGVHAGKYGIYDYTHSSYFIAGTSTGVSGATYTRVSTIFVVPAGCTMIQPQFSSAAVASSAFFDDISVTPLDNTALSFKSWTAVSDSSALASNLSVQGSNTGISSNATGVRNSAYNFDGSTGYLRQATTAVNVGNLTYSGNTLTDDGQVLTSYKTSSGNAAYMAVVTNSDNTISWGYIGNNSEGTNTITMYTTLARTVQGWNGTAISGKTPAGYEIRKTDFQITGNMTLGAWVKRSNMGYRMVMSKGDGDVSNPSVVYSIGFNSNDYPFFGGVTGTQAITDTNWHYLVATYIPSTSVYLYLDGNVVGSRTTGVSASISDSSGIFNIGTYQDNHWGLQFGGSIDEPFIAMDALSASQILDMYNKGSAALNHTNKADQKLSGSTNTVQTVWGSSDGTTIYAGTDTALSIIKNGKTGNYVDSDSVITALTTSSTPALLSNNSVAMDVMGSSTTTPIMIVGSSASGVTALNTSSALISSTITAPFYKYGNAAVKLDNSTATLDAVFATPLTLTKSTYTLSSYIYTDGSPVATGDAVLYANSQPLPSSFEDIGGGWWRMSNPFTGTSAAALNFGVQVKPGKTVYVDGIQLENWSRATTYADGSLGTGYSWSGTANNSSSSRVRTDLSYPIANTISPATAGTISFWINWDPDKMISLPDLFYGTWSGGSNEGFFSYYIKSGDVLSFYNRAPGANSVVVVNGINLSKGWHLLSFGWQRVSDGNDILTVWADTTAKGRITTGTLDTSPTFSSVYFGGRAGNTYKINNMISDIKVFDQQLSNSEVADLYNQGFISHQNGAEAFDRYLSSGIYTSPAIDLGANGQWGETPLTFSHTLNGGTITYATRSSSDGIVWGDWSAFAGTIIASAPRRYLQWKADIAASTGISVDSPVISGMTVKYIEDTTAPVNPSSLAEGFASSASSSASLISGNWYNYSGAKFTWDSADDVAANGQSASGIDSYYVFLTPNQDATPSANIADDCFRQTTDIDRSFTIGTSPALCHLTDGTYYLRFQAKDNSGNVSDPVTLFTYRYDGSIPSAPASISSTSVGYTSNNSFTFFWPAALDNGPSGLKGYEYKTGTSSGTFADWIFTTGTAATNISAYQEGQNFFMVRTVDNAGNASGTTSNNVSMASFYYNASAPTQPKNVNITPSTSESAPSASNVFTVTWDKPATFSGEIQKYYYCVNCTPAASVMTETNPSETVNRKLENIALATQQGKNTFFIVAEDNNTNPDTGHGNRNFDAYASTDFYASTVAPAAPTSLVVSDASDRDALIWRLTLTWKAPATGGIPKIYQVYRADDAGEYSKLGETTSTAYTDADLVQSTQYSYKVRAVDNAGSVSLFSAIVTRSPEGKYTAPPTAGGTPTSTVGSTTAVIKWTTSRLSFGTVEYGKTSDYGSAATESTATKDHSVKITGLAPGVVYHFRVQSLDDSSLVDYNRVDAYSSDYSFTTLNTAAVTGIAVTDIGLDSAVISWKTSSLSTSKVEYGLTMDYGSSVDVSSSASESAHTTRISGLTHSTIYHFRVRGTTSDGDDIFSQDNTFQTTIFPKVTALVMNTDQDAAGTTVVLAWSTNVPTTGEIVYQAAELDTNQVKNLKLKITDEDLQKMTQAELAAVPVIPKGAQQIIYSGELLDKHIQRISGLSDGSVYIFTIRGRDEKGNQAISDPIRYVTGADTRPPTLQNIIIETPMSGVGADAKAQIIISWETDEPATSQVLWGAGTGSEYPQASEKETALTTKHVVVVRDLLPTSSYHLKIISTDKTGNKVESKDTVVVTPSSQQAAFDIIIKNLEDVFGFLKL